MTFSLRKTVVLVAAIAVMAMAPVAPEAGNIIFLGIGAAAILLMRRDALDALRRPLVWMSLLALLLLAIAYVIGSGTVDGLIGLAFVAPVFAIWPLVAAGSEPADPAGRPGNGLGMDWAFLFATLAMTGVAGACFVAVNEVLTTMTPRAGDSVANPIHFADVALLAGGLSLLGLVSGRGWGRYLFLCGPVFAAVAVVLSGTRGAVVAFAVMAVVAVAGAAFLRLMSLRQLALLGMIAVLGGILAVIFGADELSGIQRVLTDLADVARVGVPTDTSTDIRLQMYLGGLRAFLEAPIFGHGPLTFVTVARDLADVPFENAPHLHNDLADFAASAGILGLVAYALLLLAPVIEVLRMPAIEGRRALLVVVMTLIAGYFVMGLTNAMFGILNVTTCFAGICVVVGVLAGSRGERSAAGNA
jgi:O-antigen ligase